jgi:MFS family permease
MCLGLTQSYQGLLAIRFLMGIFETGLPAGAALLIASYYRKKELSYRFALFFAFGESGSCFSGVSALCSHIFYTLTNSDSFSVMLFKAWMDPQASLDGDGKSSAAFILT